MALHVLAYNLTRVMNIMGPNRLRAELAESIKLKPEVNSLAQIGTQILWETNPEYLAFRAKTLDIGLRRAGFPDE
jgi:hypothetical protein